jgi:MFS family permease
VDQLSWRWVFYINIIPGLIAAALVAFAWRDQIHGHGRPVVDYAGAGLLTASVVTLLLGLMDYGTSSSWMLIAASIVLFIALLWVENRAADPILPLHLFRERLFAISITHGILTGWAMFGSISFIPLFVQTVLGTSATQAGITISPMLLGWVSASIIGTRLLLKVGYRRLAIIGTSSLVVGAFSSRDANTSHLLLMFYVTLMGIGMGSPIRRF